MAIGDIIKWRDRGSVPVRRGYHGGVGALQRDINRLFDEFFEGFGLAPRIWGTEALSEFMPRVDVSETAKEVRVSAELPGMDEKDIEVRLERGVLTISGEKKEEKEEKDKSYHRVERSYGSFTRSIALPADVDEGAAKATFKKGVLSVVLPKRAESREAQKRIEIKAE